MPTDNTQYENFLRYCKNHPDFAKATGIDLEKGLQPPEPPRQTSAWPPPEPPAIPLPQIISPDQKKFKLIDDDDWEPIGNFTNNLTFLAIETALGII